MKRLDSKGAVAPLVAIMLIVIVVCVALVVDLGHIHNVKVQMQRAVDAAALAGAQQLPDDSVYNAALAVASSNKVDNISGGDETLPAWVNPSAPPEGEDEIPTFIVTSGQWDKDALGSPASERWDSGGEPINAVRVDASRWVDNVFFWFIGGTLVKVDAIAVNDTPSPVLPIVLVSCLPTGAEELIGVPGLNVCDIATYKFNNDGSDSAAWSSLTIGPASKKNIESFIGDEGITLFNQIIYGTDETPPAGEDVTDGLEGEDVKGVLTGAEGALIDKPVDFNPNFLGCEGNVGVNVLCGLGGDYPGAQNTPDDPLLYDPLPRLFDGDEKSTDFRRIYTQDGLLTGMRTRLSNGEPITLADLVAGVAQGDVSSADPDPEGNQYGPLTFDPEDGRFDEGQFIVSSGKGYVPNFSRVLDYAGYPPVWVNNGTLASVLDDFLEEATVPGAGKKSLLFKDGNVNAPFDNAEEAYGETLKLIFPVVFAGSCETWKAISKASAQSKAKNAPLGTPLQYIGLANFLVTRAAKGPNCADHGVDSIIVSSFPGSCDADDFTPPLLDDDEFKCDGLKFPPAALEGLIKPPEGEENIVVQKIYLVE